MIQRSLVTGAGHRLGRAMALALAEQGHHVAVHYGQSKQAAEDVVAQIRAFGGAAHALQADLLDERATEALIPRAAAALGGPITCLINNASIFEPDSLFDATRTSWDRHMQSNLRAPFILSQQMAAQTFEVQRDSVGEAVATGLIVNMIDQRVRKLTPDYMTYTLAKMGLWALTQTAAQTLAPRIRVNAIGPGPTLKGADQSADGYARQRQATVLQRGSDSDDIVAALIYLLSAKAVTGQLICVDGGQHLGWQTPDVVGVD